MSGGESCFVFMDFAGIQPVHMALIFTHYKIPLPPCINRFHNPLRNLKDTAFYCHSIDRSRHTSFYNNMILIE